MGKNNRGRWFVLSVVLCVSSWVSADENKEVTPPRTYAVQPGDVLNVTVWKEEDLNKEVIVRPDGGMSFPLAGDFKAQGHTLEQIQQIIADRLTKYIPDPVVTVSALKLLGNKIFVLGKVNKPGEYMAFNYLDVVQALAMAGGMTPFAAVNEIKILRRDASGTQRMAGFRYGDIEDGKNLSQNVMLQAGDVVLVP